MSDKKVTFKDVAKLAKVSTQTVSRVINNEKSVSDSTRERVTKAIKELNYIPNLYAQNLRKRNLKVILLITLSLKFHGASLIAEAIRVNAKNSDDYQVNLNIVDSENFIEETINYMTTAYAQNISCVIINVPISAEDAEIIQHKFKNLNMVFIDVPKEAKVNKVISDNAEGSRMGISYLTKLRNPILCLIGGLENSSLSQMRVNGWLNYIKDHKKIKLLGVEFGNWETADSYEIAYRYIKENRDLNAFMVASDQMAVGVLAAAHQLNKNVPNDISIVSYDDSYEAQFYSPPLTTVRQDFNLMGQYAVEIIMNLVRNDILNKSLDHDKYETRIIPVKLIKRQSA